MSLKVRKANRIHLFKFFVYLEPWYSEELKYSGGFL